MGVMTCQVRGLVVTARCFDLTSDDYLFLRRDLSSECVLWCQVYQRPRFDPLSHQVVWRTHVTLIIIEVFNHHFHYP